MQEDVTIMNRNIIRQKPIFKKWTMRIVCLKQGTTYNSEDGLYALEVVENTTGDVVTLVKETGLLKISTRFDCIYTASEY